MLTVVMAWCFGGGGLGGANKGVAGTKKGPDGPVTRPRLETTMTESFRRLQLISTTVIAFIKNRGQ